MMLKLMEGNQALMTMLVQDRNDRGQPRRMQTTMKTSATMDFPPGTPKALENLDAWLCEFERVAKHVSSGLGLSVEDRIAHLVTCWPIEMDVGENLRLDQDSERYKDMDERGDALGCWKMLLDRLNTYRQEPVICRRKAEREWSDMT